MQLYTAELLDEKYPSNSRYSDSFGAGSPQSLFENGWGRINKQHHKCDHAGPWEGHHGSVFLPRNGSCIHIVVITCMVS